MGNKWWRHALTKKGRIFRRFIFAFLSRTVLFCYAQPYYTHHDSQVAFASGRRILYHEALFMYWIGPPRAPLSRVYIALRACQSDVNNLGNKVVELLEQLRCGSPASRGGTSTKGTPKTANRLPMLELGL